MPNYEWDIWDNYGLGAPAQNYVEQDYGMGGMSSGASPYSAPAPSAPSFMSQHGIGFGSPLFQQGFMQAPMQYGGQNVPTDMMTRQAIAANAPMSSLSFEPGQDPVVMAAQAQQQAGQKKRRRPAMQGSFGSQYDPWADDWGDSGYSYQPLGGWF